MCRNYKSSNTGDRSFCWTDEAFLPQPSEPLPPNRICAQSTLITNHNQAPLGACDGNIQPPGICKEANIALWVASDSTEYNDLLLSPLKPIDGLHLQQSISQGTSGRLNGLQLCSQLCHLQVMPIPSCSVKYPKLTCQSKRLVRLHTAAPSTQWTLRS